MIRVFDMFSIGIGLQVLILLDTAARKRLCDELQEGIIWATTEV